MDLYGNQYSQHLTYSQLSGHKLLEADQCQCLVFDPTIKWPVIVKWKRKYLDRKIMNNGKSALQELRWKNVQVNIIYEDEFCSPEV